MASSKVKRVGEERVRIETPPDPTTGAMAVELDVLEAVHATCQHVPPKRMHLVLLRCVRRPPTTEPSGRRPRPAVVRHEPGS